MQGRPAIAEVALVEGKCLDLLLGLGEGGPLHGATLSARLQSRQPSAHKRTDYAAAAKAARERGMNRLAERLDNAK